MSTSDSHAIAVNLRRKASAACCSALAILAISLPGSAGAVPMVGPTGNHYEVIAIPMSWADANTAASAMTFMGTGGFLATATSAAENAFIASLLGGDNAWLGGNDINTPDTWEWVAGPEAGVDFWQGQVAGSPVGGAYTNWGAADPNNSGGNQDAQLICAQNVSPCVNENLGQWIDRPQADLHNFVVEYATAVPIPEPSTAGLVGLGLAGIAASRGRRGNRHDR